MSEQEVRVTSLFGARTRQPLVTITFPDGAEITLTVGDARAVALNILEGAEAAEQDAFLFAFGTRMRRDEPDAEQYGALLLRAFREARHKHADDERTP